MTETIGQYRFFELLAKGGWVMLPLLLCSLVALAVVIERFFCGPKHSRVIPKKFYEDVLELISKQRYEETIGLCRANNSPLARVILSVMSNIGRSREEIREAIELAGRKEAAHLQRYLGTLGTIAAITPLLGLLGTVFGMITTFSVIRVQGVGHAEALSGGIAEALYTTAAGLTIAIPALVFYRFFLHRAKSLTIEMEHLAVEIFNSTQLEHDAALRELHIKSAK